MWGTYLHGFFDASGIGEEFVAEIGRRKKQALRAEPEETGQAKIEKVYEDWQAYKEKQYDKLADLLRESLDMKKIYEILDQGLEDRT